MSYSYMRFTLPLAVACLLSGCAATRAPAGHDPDYPKGWQPLVGLGEGCKNLDGRYENDGILVNARGVETSFRLTDLLFASGKNFDRTQDADATREVTSVSLSYRATKSTGNTSGSLQIRVDLAGRSLERRFDDGTFCDKEIVLVSPWIRGSVELFGPGGAVRNVWLGFSAFECAFQSP